MRAVEAIERLIDAKIKAAQWKSDMEANPLSALTGITPADLAEDEPWRWFKDDKGIAYRVNDAPLFAGKKPGSEG